MKTGQTVSVRLSDHVAGFAGLETCGSVWVCPCCNSKVMMRRALELGAAVERWEKRGGVCRFVTLTVRHHRGHSLAEVWKAVSTAWHRVTSGKAWVADVRSGGIAGWARVVECTHSAKNGWHVHAHVLMFCEPSRATGSFGSVFRRIFERWASGAEKAGLPRPLRRAQDWRTASGDQVKRRLGEYLTKAQYVAAIGFEMTATQSKTAKKLNGSRGVWELLEGAQNGSEADRRLWAEWERVSRGKRQLTWSRGIRELLALGAEEEDEAIAAEEVGSEADTIAVITARGWSVMVAGRLCSAALCAAENGTLTKFLDEHGIEWMEV